MTWVELDSGVCYELGDDSFLLQAGRSLLQDHKALVRVHPKPARNLKALCKEYLWESFGVWIPFIWALLRVKLQRL